MKSFLKYVFASTIGFFIAQTMLFVMVFLVIGGLIGASVAKKSKPLDFLKNKQSILKLDLSGEFIEKEKFQGLYFDQDIPFFGKDMPTGLYEVEKALKKAAEDDKIKGLYIEVGDIKAGWATLSSLRKAIERFKKSKKFVYAYGDIFSETNYYVASVADLVFMYPQGEFELNGFGLTPQFFKETLERLKIKPMVHRAGAYKSAVEPFITNKMSPESREQTQVYIDKIWDVFSAAVAKSRKMNPDDIQVIASDLLVNSAEEAKETKLVDELKYEDEVLEFMKGAVGVKKSKKVPFVKLHKYLFGNSKKVSFTMSLFSNDDSDGDSDDDSENEENEIEVDEVNGKKIAVIYAEGEIVGGNSYDRLLGAKSIIKELRSARKDKNVRAVVLRINSPGGSALASDEIWREVFLTNKKKPVVASMGNMAASGGYYIAAGAGHIMAEELTLTGSIGVFGLSFVTKEFFNEKLGMSFDRVVTHQYADQGNSTREPTEYELSVINKEIDRVYNRFLQVVSGNRGMSIASAKALAGGRIWSGIDAQKNKLVDELGGMNDAILWAAKKTNIDKDYEIQFYPKYKDPFAAAVGAFSHSLVNVIFGAYMKIMPEAFTEVGQKMKNQALRKKGVYMLMSDKILVQ